MNLDHLLARLSSAGLIESLDEPEKAYEFNHALMQDSVYGSLLKSQRRDLHRAVAQAIERTFPKRRGKLSEVLAYHWELAQVPDRARRYLFRAAQNATRQYANQEALALLERALAQSAGASPEEMMALRESRAQIFEFLSRPDLAVEDYQAALWLARQVNLPIDECRIMSRLAWLYSLNGKRAEAVAMAVETETKAHALQDQAAALRAYLVEGLVAQAEGNLAYAYPRLRRALFASRASDERVMEGECLYYLGSEDEFMGRFGRAAASAGKAYEIKKGLSDHAGEITSLYLIARAEGGRGNYDAALQALEAGHAVADEIHNPFGRAQYPNTRAWLCAELGDWQSAHDYDVAGLAIARRAGVRPSEISTLISLVLDCTALGELSQADEHVGELDRWMEHEEIGFYAWRWQIELTEARARLELARACYDQADDLMRELLESAAHTGSTKYLARGRLLRGQLHVERKEFDAAEADFVAACYLADVMGYVPVRLQARRRLIELDERNGTDAAPRRDEAARIIADLGQRLKDAGLRRSFQRGIAASTR
jgi:hypothetical protein